MKKVTLIGVATLATLVLGLAPAALAGAAKDDDRVVKVGTCSIGSTWKLKAKTDDGRVEVEFEVDQNRVGKRWRVTLKRDGATVFNGIRTTRAPSGSFSVERLLAGSTGSTRIVASAKAVQGSESCSAALVF
jgi:hypothetical protein